MEIPSLPVSIISIVLAYKLYRRLRYNLPPGPYPWPIVGNLFSMEADRAKCYEKWSRTYGHIISVWFGSRLNVIVSDSELAKEVLKDKDQQLANRHRSQPASALTKNGQDLTWADYGPHYVKVRKICALELFSPKRIQELMPIREDEVRAMIESIYADCANPDDGNKKCLLLRKYLASVAFNNITRSVLGKRFWNERGELDEQGLEFKSIVANELKLGSSLGLTEHFWWLNWIFRLADKAFSEHLERKDRLIQAIIEEHRISDKENGEAKQHFVDALLSLQEKHDISEDTTAGLLWDFIAAGMDTVAIAVEWGMAELVRNPRVQQRAQKELDLVIGRDRAMTELDILKLPYLQGVVKEVLRLHPPTPLMLPHRANSDINLGGYDVPEGTIVYVDVQAIGRNPAKWQDPLEFYPERFLKEDVDMKGHDFRLLPFGSGRRICPAAQLSINLVTSMIGHLLHHFRWTQPEGVQSEEIDMSGTPAMVNYMKTPLQAVPAMRLPPHMYKFTH